MKILHIIQRYHPAQGGAERHMEEISSYLAASGHEVTVATTDALDFELFWDPAQKRIKEHESEYRDVKILRFPVRHLPGSQLAFPGLRRLLWLLSNSGLGSAKMMVSLGKYTPWVPEIWRWVESTDTHFDLIGGMTIVFETLLAAGLSFSKRQGIPFVCYPLTHLGAGSKPADDKLSRFYTMRHQREIVLASDALIAQTPTEGAYYQTLGYDPEKITIGGPGVTLEDILGGDGQRFRDRYGISAPLILSIGAMSYDKGTVHTVEAVRQMWQAGHSVELVLIGALLTPFKDYFKRLPASDRNRINILDSAGEEEKRDALAAATMLSLPSRTDSFGIVFLEAWLYGLPVIGAQTWGVSDVIDDGKDGYLVPFGDVSALVEAINDILMHPDKAGIMGERGRKKVYEHHTWARKCSLIEEIYKELLSKPSP